MDEATLGELLLMLQMKLSAQEAVLASLVRSHRSPTELLGRFDEEIALRLQQVREEGGDEGVVAQLRDRLYNFRDLILFLDRGSRT